MRAIGCGRLLLVRSLVWERSELPAVAIGLELLDLRLWI